MYRSTIEQSHFANVTTSFSFIKKTLLFAITLTWPKTVFIKKTLIFSKTVD